MTDSLRLFNSSNDGRKEPQLATFKRTLTLDQLRAMPLEEREQLFNLDVLASAIRDGAAARASEESA